MVWKIAPIAEDVIHLYGFGSRTLVVAFSAYQPDWSMISNDHGFDFLNLCINLNCDAIFLRDRKNLWYQSGVEGHSSGPLDLSSKLRRECDKYDRIVMIGCSMGGYAALLFGHLCRADAVISIAPQINIGTRAAAKIGETRWSKEFSTIDRITTNQDWLSAGQIITRPTYLAFCGLDEDDMNHFYFQRSENMHVEIIRCCHAQAGQWATRSGDVSKYLKYPELIPSYAFN